MRSTITVRWFAGVDSQSYIDPFAGTVVIALPVMRIWHGRVPIDKADDYEKLLVKRAVPDYSSVEGLLKLYFTRRDEGDVAHFLLVTV